MVHSPHPTAYPRYTSSHHESLHQHHQNTAVRRHPATAQRQQPVALPSQTSAPRRPRLRPDLAGLSYHRHAVEVQEDASEEERGTACEQPSCHPAHAFGTACWLASQHFEREPGFCQLPARPRRFPRPRGKSERRNQPGLPHPLQPAQSPRSRTYPRNAFGRPALFAAAAAVDGRKPSPIEQPALPQQRERSRSTIIQQPRRSPRRFSPSALSPLLPSEVAHRISRLVLRTRINALKHDASELQLEATRGALETALARIQHEASRVEAWKGTAMALLLLCLAYAGWCKWNSAEFAFIGECRRKWFEL